MSSDDMTGDREKIRAAVTIGYWEEIFNMFKEKRELRTANITGTGDTMLHIAVCEQEVDVVERMVDFVCGKKINEHDMSTSVDEDGDERKLVFGARNGEGNTPLHLAATTSRKSSVTMCKKIGYVYRALIAARNEAGETPLFLAALYGRRDTFLWLHYLYMESPEVSPTEFAHCIRDNDDTILHCAIAGGHIDVAIEIVHLYKGHLKEMMRRNKEGSSPLHLLAAQPSAFRSTWLRHEQPNFLVALFYVLSRGKEKNQATTLEELPSIEKHTRSSMKELRQKHAWSVQVLVKLLQHASDEDMSRIISKKASDYHSVSLQTENKDKDTVTIDTPLMIAIKNGVMEMVFLILMSFPSRVKDVNTEGKNIFLLAIEYSQHLVSILLLTNKWQIKSLFEQVDKEGNNALHLAAMKESNMLSPEYLYWFELMKKSTPPGLLGRCNRKMQTPEDIFNENYMKLLKRDAEWARKASEAFSVVSTLVTTVAFTTRSTVPGGYDGRGYAILRHKPSLFKAFAFCEIFALFFSLISTLIFLTILTSPPQSTFPPESIRSIRNVARRLNVGIYTMFTSVGLLWISFCAGHFFTLDHKGRKSNYAILLYIFLSSMVIIFSLKYLATISAPLISRFWFPGILDISDSTFKKLRSRIKGRRIQKH